MFTQQFFMAIPPAVAFIAAVCFLLEKKWKRGGTLLLILVVLLGVMLLTGCGQSSATSSGSEPTPTSIHQFARLDADEKKLVCAMMNRLPEDPSGEYVITGNMETWVANRFEPDFVGYAIEAVKLMRSKNLTFRTMEGEVFKAQHRGCSALP